MMEIWMMEIWMMEIWMMEIWMMRKAPRPPEARTCSLVWRPYHFAVLIAPL
jgi:hypothetical protein